MKQPSHVTQPRSQTPSNPIKPGQTQSNRVKPNQTGSNPIKSGQTQSNRVKPNQTGSNPIKPDQTQSNRVKPNQTGSNPIKPDQTQSNRIKPSQTGSNPVKPDQTCGAVGVSRNWTIQWGKRSADSSPVKGGQTGQTRSNEIELQLDGDGTTKDMPALRAVSP
jgi:hypothetical protein